MSAPTTTASVTAAPAVEDLRIPSLHESIRQLLPLTPKERQNCSVFALHGDFRPEEDEARTGRFAIAYHVAREDWPTLQAGDTLIYTALEPVPAKDIEREGCSSWLRTHCGPLRVYDAERGVFYAYSWAGLDGEERFAADDVQEIYLVQRFIEAQA
jgi:hypothetical protein